MNYFCTERPSEPREHLDAVRTTHTSARLAQVKSALTEGVNYLAAVSAL